MISTQNRDRLKHRFNNKVTKQVFTGMLAGLMVLSTVFNSFANV